MKGKWNYLLLTAIFALGCGDSNPPFANIPSRMPSSPTVSTPIAAEHATRPTGSIAVCFTQVTETVANNRINPSGIARRCVEVIEGAQKSLDICCQEIDNQLITQAVIRAHQRGVAVRVVSEGDYADETGLIAFREAGIPVLVDSRDALMHNKFMVVDGNTVWTGSFNFTENCAYKNNNNAVVVVDSQVAANYSEKFRWFWEERKFGGKPSKRHSIPFPLVTLSDGTKLETAFSTHDQIDKKVIDALSRARTSIDFLAFSFTHEGIARAMLERADKGVKVRGVFESRQNSKYSEFNRLSEHRNVQVYLDGNRYTMHHKVILIDGQTVITGSFNFSTSATSDNDENIVIIHNPEVCQQFETEFSQVMAEAQKAMAGSGGGLLR